jgi:hypothetical protein
MLAPENIRAGDARLIHFVITRAIDIGSPLPSIGNGIDLGVSHETSHTLIGGIMSALFMPGNFTFVEA